MSKPIGTTAGIGAYIPSMDQVRKFTVLTLSQPFNLLWFLLRIFQRKNLGLPTHVMRSEGLTRWNAYKFTYLKKEEVAKTEKDNEHNIRKGYTIIKELSSEDKNILYPSYAVLRTKDRWHYLLIGKLINMDTERYLSENERADALKTNKYAGKTIQKLTIEQQTNVSITDEAKKLFEKHFNSVNK